MLPTLRRVVIGVDFTEPSLAAARWAVAHFVPGVEVVLVHSAEVAEPPGFLREDFPELATLADTRAAEAEARLREIAASLGAPEASLRVPRGRAAEQLLEVAREVQADLIIVGRHNGAGFLERLGSTAEALVRSSGVPVVVAAGRMDRQPTALLAALDYDELAAEVLRWTALLAQRSNADVTAVHVMSNGALSHVLSVEAVKTGKKHFTEEEIRSRFRDDAEHWMERLMEASLERDRARTEIVFGQASNAIVEAATRLGSDLIVLGRRGKRPFRRMLLGSVVRDVLRKAPCPVLVVVEPEDELV